MRYSRDQLSAMSLFQLRNIDIKTREEELQIQEFVDSKLANVPVETNVYRGDVPDIKTVEEEKKWQEIIDKREEEAKIPPVLPTVDDKIAEAEAILAEVQSEVTASEPVETVSSETTSTETPKVIKAKTKTKKK